MLNRVFGMYFKCLNALNAIGLKCMALYFPKWVSVNISAVYYLLSPLKFKNSAILSNG